MPRLTSKMTVKIEPELLQRIQETSESRNISVSYYVREALIKYQREADDDRTHRSLRVNLTPMEMHVLTELKRIGVISDGEHLFHKSFDSFLVNDLDRTLEVGIKLRDMKGFSSEDQTSDRTADSDIVDDPEENIDQEGDTNK